MALPPILVELKASSGEFMTKMGEARHEVAKLGTESAGHLQKFSTVGKAALLGIVGVAAAVGGASLEMADKFEKAHAKLETAFKNSGSELGDWSGQLNDTQTKMQKFGFTNTEVQGALANLVTATKDTKGSFSQLSVAADLARFKGISLADASTAVGKALAGQLRPLKQLGIDLPVTAGGAAKLKAANVALSAATTHYHQLLEVQHSKSKLTLADHLALHNAQLKMRDAQQKVNDVASTGQVIMKTLADRIGGQAAAASETFAGKIAAAKAQVENLGTKLGMALIPVLMRVIGVVSGVVTWLGKHRDIAIVLAGVIGGALVAAIIAYTVTMAQAAIATLAATWPILAIIAACAAVVVGLYELYRHWSSIWGFIKRIASDAWQWIHQHLIYIALAFGPLGLAAYALYRNWSTVWGGIKAVTSGVWNGVIKPIFGFYKAEFHAIATVLSWLYNNVWSPVWSAITTAVLDAWNIISGIFDSIKQGISTVTGGIGGLLKHIPGGSAVTGALGSLLHFDSGGVVPGPMGAARLVVAHGGETILPTHKRGFGGGDIVVHNVITVDGDVLHRSVQRYDQRYRKRSGRSAFDAA